MKYILSLLVALFMSATCFSEDFKAPTKETTVYTDTTTVHTYEIKGEKYPIFKSKNNRYYIWKTSSKTGKLYKYYLPKKVQEQIKNS